MKISTLAKNLEDRINDKIALLFDEIKVCQELFNEGAEESEIRRHLKIQVKIAQELEPVLYLVEFHNPDLKPLFAELLKPPAPKRPRKIRMERVDA